VLKKNKVGTWQGAQWATKADLAEELEKEKQGKGEGEMTQKTRPQGIGVMGWGGKSKADIFGT